MALSTGTPVFGTVGILAVIKKQNFSHNQPEIWDAEKRTLNA
jgi:hypothetical protein